MHMTASVEIIVKAINSTLKTVSITLCTFLKNLGLRKLYYIQKASILEKFLSRKLIIILFTFKNSTVYKIFANENIINT